MAKITLSAATWVCVNPGAAYASGVEITINVGKTTANLRYELKNSDTVAPNQIEDITEAVQTLSVKAVDGKGFLWLISQGVDVDVQIETITPAFTSITFPDGMASETKQNDQITELQAIKTAVQTVAAESDATTITGYIDSVGVRFLTRFDPTATQKTKHYRLDDGTAYSPVAPFELISSNIEVFNYVATSAGTGYSLNDILVKFTDTETKSSAWRNETTNLAISSPISGTYGEIGKVGAATETKQDAQITEAQTINSNLGAKADLSASSDTGAFSLISLTKRSLQDWTTFLNRMPSKGQNVAANSLPVVLPADQITAITPPTSVSVNNLPATQQISAASLPLPSGAATLAEQQTQTLEIKKISKRAAFAVMQDVSGVKFIRVINDDNTTRDFALDGTAYAPALPVSAYVDNQSIAVVGYVAKTANAPLYLIGDVIYNVLVSTETGVVSGWFNNKTGTYVTPNMAHLELQAATEATQNSILSRLNQTISTSEALPIAAQIYSTSWSGLNSGEFTLQPNVMACFNFAFTGSDSVKLQKKGFGADTNFYDVYLYDGVLWVHASNVAASQVRFFETRANSGVFRFVRTNSAVNVIVVQ